MTPRLAVLLCALMLSTGACLVDEGRCSPHQELNGSNACVCEKGYVPDEQLKCRPCGEHEVSQGDVCECAPGFQRSAEMACVPAAIGLGQSCSSDGDCQASAPHCEQRASSPYCTTQGCTASSDCANGYACDTEASPAFCKRGPSGLGVSCSKQEDCAGNEASYCELNRAKACLVPNCKIDSDCFLGWECCDLTVYGLPTLCVREAACPVP